MARGEREVKVTVVGDSSSGQRALKQLDDQADRTDSKFSGLGGKLVSFGKVAALGLGAAAVGVGAILKSSVEAAEESRKVMAQTDAVIKSTGGVARVTAADVDKLASSLSAMSGIDDEVIASGQNKLLTFTQVRNEVGKGNDVFNQATKAALDMSVALGTDMNSASMLVGKALNDPIKGMTALTRSGIQFTEQQKEQVKAMVAAGDTLGAQKIILKELETQFGGSAAAAASPMARLKVVVGNLQEELGARFLPVAEKAATFLADKLPKAFDAVGRGLALLKSGFAEGNVSESSGFLGSLLAFAPKVREALETIVDWVKKNWPEIKKIITETMKTVQAVIKGVVDVISTIWENFGDQIMDVIAAAWTFVKSTIDAALKVIQGIVKTVTSLIKGDWSGVWEGIKMILAGAWDFIVARVQLAIDIVKSILSVAWEIIKAGVSAAWDGIKGVFASAWDGIKDLARSGVASIVDTFLGMVGIIIGAAERAFGWIPGIGGKVKEAARAFEEFRDRTNAALRGTDSDKTIRITTVYEDVYVQRGDRTYGGMSTAGISQYHTGGIVPGSGDVPAILQGGEGVFTPEQMAVLGASMGRGGGGSAAGDTYVFNFAGSLVTEHAFIEAVQAGLLQKQRRVPTLGLT